MRSSSIFPFNISKPFTSSGKTPRSSSTASLENNSGNDENFFTKKKRKKKKGLSSYIDNISVKFVVIQLSAFKRAHGSVTIELIFLGQNYTPKVNLEFVLD